MLQSTYANNPVLNNHIVKETLKCQLEYNKKIITLAERALKKAPEGRLRVCESGNRIQYYHCSSINDPATTQEEDAASTNLASKEDTDKYHNGKYISKKQIKLVEMLAQKDYNLDVLNALKEETKEIEDFLTKYSESRLGAIRQKMRKARRSLVKPYDLSDEEYLAYWENDLYPKENCRTNTSNYFTNRGEYVRSKSEKIIADELNRQGIPYRYEYPLNLGGAYRIHPDFTVLNIHSRKTYYWEHCGMMDYTDYVEKLSDRLLEYEKKGFFPGENIIMTFESEQNPLSTRSITMQIEHYLKG